MDEPDEEWRPINEWYAVSSYGRIWSRARNKYLGKVLNFRGYVTAKIDRSGRNSLVHRLVAHSFLGPCPDGMVVDHKNGIRTDNRIENLQYLSRADNARQPGEKNPQAKLTAHQVREIRCAYESGKSSQVALGRAYGVTNQAIHDIVRRRNWRHI